MQRLLADTEELYQTGMQISAFQCGTVRIATAYRAFYDQISRDIRDLHETYPGITVEIVDGGYSRS